MLYICCVDTHTTYTHTYTHIYIYTIYIYIYPLYQTVDQLYAYTYLLTRDPPSHCLHPFPLTRLFNMFFLLCASVLQPPSNQSLGPVYSAFGITLKLTPLFLLVKVAVTFVLATISPCPEEHPIFKNRDLICQMKCCNPNAVYTTPGKPVWQLSQKETGKSGEMHSSPLT